VAQKDLERLREEIARCRAQRATVAEEFERFVGSFKTSPAPRPPKTRSYERAAEFVPGNPIESQPSPSPRPRSSSRTAALLGGALLVLVCGGLIAKTLRERVPESTAIPANPPEPAVEPSAPAALPQVAAAVPAAATQQSAITTSRRVWMRVTVDGARVVEREVPAGTRLPLAAEKTIVIRTGDAGAVRLSIRGQDQGFLGAEGEVVTRSFAVPQLSRDK
jgi:hypothetical protein